MRSAGWGFASLALAIVIGAFGTHSLRGEISEAMLAVFQTGQQYHVTASLALIAIGLVQNQRDDLRLKVPARLLGAGAIVFSGSLYALALTEIRMLGAVTPIGGVLMITSCVWTAVALLKAPPKS